MFSPFKTNTLMNRIIVIVGTLKICIYMYIFVDWKLYENYSLTTTVAVQLLSKGVLLSYIHNKIWIAYTAINKDNLLYIITTKNLIRINTKKCYWRFFFLFHKKITNCVRLCFCLKSTRDYNHTVTKPIHVVA